MITYLWIALGGALGSMARFGCSQWVSARLPIAFPLGILLVNVLGSFVIGVIAALSEAAGDSQTRWQLPVMARQFLITGVLGGYTTFSSFSLQTVLLAREGAWLVAGANVLLSVTLCLLACWGGFALMSAFSR